MIRTISFGIFTLLVGSLSAEESAAADVKASSVIRQAIVDSVSVNVYEGLPHQTFERDKLGQESKRKDTEKIGSYRFYTPAAKVANVELLKRILSSPETIQAFRGEKLCGGFHPDYAVEWFGKDGSRFYALICFGCHEIIFSDGKDEYRYDFEDQPFEQLKKELEPYAKKRPKHKEG